ncbi:MAG: RNA polymerase sporulation sigma factor SigE [Clostridiales bacterium]|nr:RNA polymerase sporulation sigma factor SigE [Clostridiales bacterium]
MIFGRILQAIKRALSVLPDDECDLEYITSGDGLPHPLEPQEEAAALARLKTDPAVKTLLIEHNLRLVVYIARKFDNTGVDVEDLISIGTVGLIKAVNSFDTDKNIKLATYASRCIENEILMHLRRVVRLRAEVSLDEPLNVDVDGNELVMADILGTDPDTVGKELENEAECRLLNDALERLNKRERSIMQMRFGLGGANEKTQKEVADILGISQSYISRLEKKIIYRLKKDISKALQA